MKKFFEEYGFVILTAIVVILLIAMATPIGTLIRSNVSHIVESFGEKTTQKPDYAMREYQAKDVIEVAGKKLTIMENLGNDKYLVLAEYQSYNKVFNTQEKGNVYENSTVDNYLSNNYYNNLPETIKNAIVEQNISQAEYNIYGTFKWNSDRYKWESDKGTQVKVNDEWVSWNDSSYVPQSGRSGYYSFDFSKYIDSKSIGTRKVFLPSVKELSNVVNVNDEKEMDTFLKDSNGNRYHMWLRDAYGPGALYANYNGRSLYGGDVWAPGISVRPAFVLDLSKVGYEKVK